MNSFCHESAKFSPLKYAEEDNGDKRTCQKLQKHLRMFFLQLHIKFTINVIVRCIHPHPIMYEKYMQLALHNQSISHKKGFKYI